MHGAFFTSRIGALALLGVIIVGCGRTVARVSDVPMRSSAAGDSCWAAPPPVVSSDSLLIVLQGWGGEGPGAARFDEGRRLVAALTAETQIPTDCAGAQIPGATIRWRRDSSAQGERYLASGVRLAVRVAPLDASADPRDALDLGADLLVTADPAAVAYAGALGDRVIVPLEKRWTYGVLTAGLSSGNSLAIPGLERLRVSLSREVVPAAARAVVDSSAATGAGCADVPAAARAASRRIVYRADDPVARAIAGRLASLAAAGDATMRALVPHDGAPLVAVPLDPRAFAAALAGAEDAVYVVAWQSSSGDRCATEVLQAARAEQGDASWSTAMVTPLIDAGQWAIVKVGAVGLVKDSRGELWLVPAAAPLRSVP